MAEWVLSEELPAVSSCNDCTGACCRGKSHMILTPGEASKINDQLSGGKMRLETVLSPEEVQSIMEPPERRSIFEVVGLLLRGKTPRRVAAAALLLLYKDRAGIPPTDHYLDNTIRPSLASLEPGYGVYERPGDCPALNEENKCGIYDERPGVCRDFAVNSPACRVAFNGPKGPAGSAVVIPVDALSRRTRDTAAL